MKFWPIPNTSFCCLIPYIIAPHLRENIVRCISIQADMTEQTEKPRPHAKECNIRDTSTGSKIDLFKYYDK